MTASASDRCRAPAERAEGQANQGTMRLPIPERHAGLVRQATKFGATGLVNTGVSFVTFNLTLRLVAGLSRPALVAQAVSYAVGMVTSFVLNSRWTFAGNRAPRGTFARFVALQVAVLAASSWAISWLVDVRQAQPQLSWLGVTVLATAVNFVGQRLWVFPSARPGESQEEPA